MIKFTKMHGLGNDFMVIDAVTQNIALTSATVCAWADRHCGIGFDQLLLVEKPQSPDVDFNYRIFNADGSEVGQCGNGARCLARFIHEQGLSAKTELTVATLSSTLQLKLLENGSVAVSLPVISVLEGKTVQDLQYVAVDVGNPHAVLTMGNVREADLRQMGALFNQHSDFPDGVNVGCMEIVSRERIKLRVYERGVGETAACGSGACAAVVAGVTLGLLSETVLVELAGGELRVEWPGEGDVIWLIGPATSIFTGHLK